MVVASVQRIPVEWPRLTPGETRLTRCATETNEGWSALAVAERSHHNNYSKFHVLAQLRHTVTCNGTLLYKTAQNKMERSIMRKQLTSPLCIVDEWGLPPSAGCTAVAVRQRTPWSVACGGVRRHAHRAAWHGWPLRAGYMRIWWCRVDDFFEPSTRSPGSVEHAAFHVRRCLRLRWSRGDKPRFWPCDPCP